MDTPWYPWSRNGALGHRPGWARCYVWAARRLCLGSRRSFAWASERGGLRRAAGEPRATSVPRNIAPELPRAGTRTVGSSATSRVALLLAATLRMRMQAPSGVTALFAQAGAGRGRPSVRARANAMGTQDPLCRAPQGARSRCALSSEGQLSAKVGSMPRVSKLPQRLQPMLAVLTDAPFDDADWVFESKWDGFRMVASIEDGKVALFSRNGKIISESYRLVARALEKIKHDAVLDGELVALDSHGRARFQLLQNALRSQANLRYYLFDLMFLDGADVRGLSLLERKERLRRLIPRHPLLAFSAHRPQHGTKYFEEAQKQGLEGIMAKRAASPYLSGQRSGDWLKIKTARRQEVVIAGFTAPRRTRPYFGALVLAVGRDSGWRYIGHRGTGFAHGNWRDLY